MKSHETETIAGLALGDGWSPIRRGLGIQAFGVNAWTAREAGATVIQEHDEDSGHEELYVVVGGHARFTVDGDELDAPAGTLVFIRDPKAKRGAVATEPETTVLVVGAKPGEPFRPMPWEVNAEVLPLFEEDGSYFGVPMKILRAVGNVHGVRADLVRARGPAGDEGVDALWEGLKAHTGWDLIDFPDTCEDGAFQRLVVLAQRDHSGFGAKPNK